MLLSVNLNTNVILVTPVQKQKVTWFSKQFQFYHNKTENFGKIWLVDAGFCDWVLLAAALFVHGESFHSSSSLT